MTRAFNISPPWLPAVTAAAWYLLLAVLMAVMALGGCGDGGGGGSPEEGTSYPDLYANRIVTINILNVTGADSGRWPYFFQPEAALGEPGGILDVVSLGYDPAAGGAFGGSITLGLGDAADASDRACAVDRDGPDLAVFENPFETLDGETSLTGTNNEVAIVEVSSDNAVWYLIPWSIDTGRELVERERYTNLGGVTPTSEGGDLFDLADVIAEYGLAADYKACYIRVTDGGLAIPDYGNTQTDLYRSGADIDAVGAFHFIAAPGLLP